MAKRKLRRHGSDVNEVALTSNTREVAPSIGLAPNSETEEFDGGYTNAKGWPMVVLNPRLAMKKGSELSR